MRAELKVGLVPHHLHLQLTLVDARCPLSPTAAAMCATELNLAWARRKAKVGRSRLQSSFHFLEADSPSQRVGHPDRASFAASAPLLLPPLLRRGRR